MVQGPCEKLRYAGMPGSGGGALGACEKLRSAGMPGSGGGVGGRGVAHQASSSSTKPTAITIIRKIKIFLMSINT